MSIYIYTVPYFTWKLVFVSNILSMIVGGKVEIGKHLFKNRKLLTLRVKFEEIKSLFLWIVWNNMPANEVVINPIVKFTNIFVWKWLHCKATKYFFSSFPTSLSRRKRVYKIKVSTQPINFRKNLFSFFTTNSGLMIFNFREFPLQRFCDETFAKQRQSKYLRLKTFYGKNVFC